MPEVDERKNGYYAGPISSKALNKARWLPAVSTVNGAVGAAEGLIRWAAKMGADGAYQLLLKELIKGSDLLSVPPTVIHEAAAGALAAERERTAQFGNNLHFGFQCMLLKQDCSYEGWSEAEMIALETLTKFYNEIGIEPYHVETPVYSEQKPQYCFGGQLDLAFPLSDEQCSKIKPYLTRTSDPLRPCDCMADFKSGRLYPRSQALQLSAYMQAYYETYGRLCSGGLLINVYRNEPTKVRCVFFTHESLLDSFYDGFIPAFKFWKKVEAPKWWLKQEEEYLKLTEERKNESIIDDDNRGQELDDKRGGNGD